MHCEVYQGTMRSLRHWNLCEDFIRFEIVCIIDQPAQSLFSLWEVLLRVIGFFKSWKLHLLLRASTSAVLIEMCTSILWDLPWSGANDSSATKPSLTALYPSTLIILCRLESRSLLTGYEFVKNTIPLMLNTGVERTRRTWHRKANSQSVVSLV